MSSVAAIRPAGSCAVCGYDLRASVGRCPECGTGIKGGRSNVCVPWVYRRKVGWVKAFAFTVLRMSLQTERFFEDAGGGVLRGEAIRFHRMALVVASVVLAGCAVAMKYLLVEERWIVPWLQELRWSQVYTHGALWPWKGFMPEGSWTVPVALVWSIHSGLLAGSAVMRWGLQWTRRAGRERRRVRVAAFYLSGVVVLWVGVIGAGGMMLAAAAGERMPRAEWWLVAGGWMLVAAGGMGIGMATVRLAAAGARNGIVARIAKGAMGGVVAAAALCTGGLVTFWWMWGAGYVVEAWRSAID